jgi:serine/threonine-protein kinase
VDAPLAAGAMGSVWRGSDTALDREVAIKLMGEAFIGDHQAVRRFMREARAAARLSSHPHVVTIFDVGEYAERPYIVMEYIAGGTVADAIADGDVTPQEALVWLEQAGSALDYAHGRGVVHRDVKPSNMLLTDNGEVRLADFGIASLVAEPTISHTGQLLGTAAYISPEQARGLPASEASDRYALAVTAFELLTGRRPFEGQHFAAQARAHMEQHPPRASDLNWELPRAVDGVLQRGMAKQAVERWPTALDFTTALREATERPHPARAAGIGIGPPTLVFAKSRAAGSAVASRNPLRNARGARIPALAALGLAIVTLAIIVESNSGPPVPARDVLSTHALKVASTAGSDAARSAERSADGIAAGLEKSRPAKSAPKPSPKPAATQTQTQPAAPPPTTTQPAPAASSGGAASLEAQGHALMESGQYSQALPILRQAVSTANPSSLTYAYALYDLGRTLRLAGDPQAAIPILQKRMQIPNQPGVVAGELHLAEQQAGVTQSAAPTPGPSPAPGGPPGPGHGHGHAYGHFGHGADAGSQLAD